LFARIHGNCLLLACIHGNNMLFVHIHGNYLLFSRIHRNYLLITLTWKGRSVSSRSPRIYISIETVPASRCLAMDYSVTIRFSGNVFLVSRWMTMDFGSGSSIPAFRCHVTMCFVRV
jgi:hypothetical protein